MRIETASFSDKGGKDVNEDTVKIVSDKDFTLAVLADGLGSHGGGDVASKITADTLTLEITDFSEEQITAAIDLANVNVIAHQKPGCEMKSTAVLAAIKDKEAILANVGDSRAYHLSGGKIAYQSFDHSVPALEVLRGKIKPEEIRFHPARNKLLRAVGTQMCKPDVNKCNVKKGDGFLLCSDGFWEYITEPEIEEDFKKSKSTEEWISNMLKRMNPRFSERHDNYSAVVAKIL
jgi:serine/threonine protein phosphatase PrpC